MKVSRSVLPCILQLVFHPSAIPVPSARKIKSSGYPDVISAAAQCPTSTDFFPHPLKDVQISARERTINKTEG